MNFLLTPGTARLASCHNHVALDLFQVRLLSSIQLKKYYDLLKVNKDSTSQDIKESFLKLSKIYHPDNKESGSHSRFVELKEAYDAIKNGPPATSDSKSHYDPSRYYEDIDLSHKTYAKYREYYKDYTNPHEYQRSQAFGGPYAGSKNPWEDMIRDRRARKRYEESYHGYGQNRNPKGISVVLGGLAWIFLYSCVLFAWDYNNHNKSNPNEKYNTNNYREYMAYRRYMRRKELKERQLRDEQPVERFSGSIENKRARDKHHQRLNEEKVQQKTDVNKTSSPNAIHMDDELSGVQTAESQPIRSTPITIPSL